ncbi:MAG: DNA-directed RNA polymerase subunit omega [Holophagaceae bacterium]|jgi:DNA-directed RNA polymerase subunit K/omega
MPRRTIVRIPQEIANKYRFAVITGRRCAQLQEDAFPKIDVVVPMAKNGQAQDAPKLASFWSNVAIQEVEQDKIAWEELKVESTENIFETPISVE